MRLLLAVLLGLLTGCASSHVVHKASAAGPPVRPSSSPTLLSSTAAQQILTKSLPAGDELTVNGYGNRTLRVRLRSASAVFFGCIGKGEQVRFAYGNDWFKGTCRQDFNSFAANTTARRYPSWLTLTISVPDATNWRVTVDSHPTDGL